MKYFEYLHKDGKTLINMSRVNYVLLDKNGLNLEIHFETNHLKILSDSLEEAEKLYSMFNYAIQKWS